jgi:hypothetical protein
MLLSTKEFIVLKMASKIILLNLEKRYWLFYNTSAIQQPPVVIYLAQVVT